MFDLFIQVTAQLTDGQYYALVIMISLLFGCGCVFLFEYAQRRWMQNYPNRILLKKRMQRRRRRMRA